jgi:hypothetical protein
VELGLKKKGTMSYRVALESATGEQHVVDVDASTDEEALEAAKAKYDPLNLAKSYQVVPHETLKGSFLNRNFVIKP